MPSPVLNFGAFSTADLQSMLTAAKAEYLVRMNPGRVRTGGSSAQQYGVDLMTLDQLTIFLNGITSALGMDNTDTLRTRPDFNNTRQSVVPGSTFGV
jgi:hypothetical protein